MNAGILAAKIRATNDESLASKLADYSKEMKDGVVAKDDKLQAEGYESFL